MFLPWVGGLAVTFGLAGAWGYGHTGRAAWIIPWLRGVRTFVEPEELSFGTATAGSLLHLGVKFANRAGRPVRLIGSHPDCSCMATGTFPMTVEAGEDRRLAIDVQLDSEVGPFEKRVVFWTDSPERPEFMVHVTGRVAR